MVARTKSSAHSHPMVKKGRKHSTTSKRGGSSRAPFKKMAKKSTAAREEKKSPGRKSAPRRAGGESTPHKSSAGGRKKHSPSLAVSAGASAAPSPANLGGATSGQGSPVQRKNVKRNVGETGEGKSPAKRTVRKKSPTSGAKKTGRKAVKKQ